MNEFWMTKAAGSLNDGGLPYGDSFTSEQKCSHLWFMDNSELEQYPNKKQAVEVPNTSLFTGMLNSNVAWGSTSSFHSLFGYPTERLLDSETIRTANFDDKIAQSIGTEKINTERQVDENAMGNASLFDEKALADPRSGVSYGGFRKVKVNEVNDSENVMPMSMRLTWYSGDTSSLSTAHTYKKADGSAISMGLTYDKVEHKNSPAENAYDREDNHVITIGQPYTRGGESKASGQTYGESNTTASSGKTLSDAGSNIVSGGQIYTSESALPTGHLFSKGEDSTQWFGQTFTENNNNSMKPGYSYNNGESTIISFGGDNDDNRNASTKLLPSYGLLMDRASAQKSDVLSENEILKFNVDANATQITPLGVKSVCKRKDELKISKKVSSNNFPSNVRSLLSTGMLDGVPVTYIAWSREKELHGVIKGSGYLCGCQSCNLSKVINAYEFERHASCKTKHPNNHIYFENGKTIYGIVQELRSAPQNILFEVIQTITGSPINQKSFCAWKESFLGATRELQLIYGNS